MGAACIKADNSESPRSSASSGGGVIGGDDSLQRSVDARTAAAMAAEARAAANKPASEYAQKAQLLGQLETIYKRRKEEMPMGVRSMGIPQLKAHLERMKSA